MNAPEKNRPQPVIGQLHAIALVAAFLLLVSACSGDSELDDSAQPDIESSTTATPETTATTAVEEAQRIDSLLAGDVVEPGRWGTGSLAAPVSFELASPLILREGSDNLVALATPETGTSGAPHLLVLLNPGGVVVFDESQPADAPYPSDLGQWLNQNPAVEVIESGAVTGGSWWEIATSENASAITPCNFGERCVEWLLLEDGGVSLVSEPLTWRFRIYELDALGDEPLLLLVQAPPESFDDLVGVGETVVSTLRSEQRSDFPETEVAIQVGGLGGIAGLEPIPPGDYQQDLDGIGVLRLKTDVPIDVVVGESSNTDIAFLDTLAAGPPGAFVVIADFPLVDPVDAASDGIDYGTTDERDVGAWAGLVDGVTIVAQGEDSIGGQTVEWWDLEIDNDAPDGATTPCLFDPSRGCVHLVEEGEAIIEIAEGSTTRVHIFKDIALKLFMQPNDRVPEAPSLEDIFARFEPLLDSLTIEN